MKRIILSLAVLAGMITSLSAQSRFGVNAGIIFSNMKSEENGGNEETLETKTGMTIGIRAAVPLTENISFRPGLNFMQKGGKEKFDFLGQEIETTINLGYLELPLNFVYSTTDAGSGRFFAGLGPVLSYGISGKAKVKTDGQEDEEDINFGDAEDELKPFEFSGNVLAGYELANGVYLQVNYSLGFSNISNSTDGTLKNNYFGVRIGYFFGGEKK